MAQHSVHQQLAMAAHEPNHDDTVAVSSQGAQHASLLAANVLYSFRYQLGTYVLHSFWYQMVPMPMYQCQCINANVSMPESTHQASYKLYDTTKPWCQ